MIVPPRRKQQPRKGKADDMLNKNSTNKEANGGFHFSILRKENTEVDANKLHRDTQPPTQAYGSGSAALKDNMKKCASHSRQQQKNASGPAPPTSHPTNYPSKSYTKEKFLFVPLPVGTSITAANHIAVVIQETNNHAVNQNFLGCDQPDSASCGAEGV